MRGQLCMRYLNLRCWQLVSFLDNDVPFGEDPAQEPQPKLEPALGSLITLGSNTKLFPD